VASPLVRLALRLLLPPMRLQQAIRERKQSLS
jgi:hypothetical protein